MSIQAVAWAISQKVGSPTGKILLICLANYADEHGVCWPSQSTIAKETELSERSTTIWLQKLEEEGFITRKRRHRTDGSRTTDYITLQLGKRPDPSEKIQTAESADRPNLTENRRKPNRSSARSKPQEIHPKEPPLEPSEEPPMGAQARERSGFSDLWEAWPEAERPDNREAARRVFERLSKADREHAVRHVKAFLVLMWQRNEPRRLFPYLKDRLFLELVDAPPRARDGDFIITPDRPEWQSWSEHSGGRLASYMAQQGRLVCKTRWPEDARKNASSLGGRNATTGSLSAGHKNHTSRRQVQ